MQKKTLRLFRNILTIASLITSCGSVDSNTTDQEVIISTGINDLKTIIDLDDYEPTAVKWKYWRVGSDNNSRLSVPGSSDYAMQAMLTFDQQTIDKIKTNYSLLSVDLKQLDKDVFKFDWLPADIIMAVNNYDSTQYDIRLFREGVHGGFIILEDTVLLYYFTT